MAGPRFALEHLLSALVEVVPYTGVESIAAAITQCLPQGVLTLQKRQYGYLENYLNEIETQTILIEAEYLDLGYLEDYSNYYSRSFRGGHQKCARLHFFSKQISKQDLLDLMLAQSKLSAPESPVSDRLPQANSRELGYQGYIVVKPLSQAYLGRTCLLTYPEDLNARGERRCFAVTKQYIVHLLGLRLAVRSLGFQEQDRIVSRCATNALWSCLQATGALFQHHLPALYEISVSDGLPFETLTRAVPSAGLSMRQMAHVMRTYRLQPELFNPRTYRQFMHFCYAYLRCGIPLIAELSVLHVTDSEERLQLVSPSARPGEGSGSHAICIVGYAMAEDEAGFQEDLTLESTPGRHNPGVHGGKHLEFRARGYGVGRVYAHDDQRGPFARLLPFSNAGNIDCFAHNSLVHQAHALGLVRDAVDDRIVPGTSVVLPTALLVPLHPLIRISYSNIITSLLFFNQVWSQALGPEGLRLCWDIYLDESLKYKERTLVDERIAEEIRVGLCSLNLPKYIWIASMSIERDRVAEFVFDATDSYLSNYLFHKIVVDPDRYRRAAKVVPSATNYARSIGAAPEPQVIQMVLSSADQL